MKITPVAGPVSMPTADPSGNLQPSRVDNIRAMKMNTRATPLGNEPHQLPNLINNSQTEEPSEATQPLSPQLALLAKQRRMLQRERAEFEKQRAELTGKAESPGIEAARIKSDPLGVLLEQGVTYEQLTEAILNSQGNSEMSALKAEIEALKQGIDQKFTDNAATQRKQVIAEMQREADALVRSDESYEFVKETGSTQKAIELIERIYDQSGEIMEVSEALRLVEEELFKDAQKIAKLKKMQGQISPMPQQMQAQQREVGMTTLTNRDTATVPVSAKQRAMAAFYGTLRR